MQNQAVSSPFYIFQNCLYDAVIFCGNLLIYFGLVCIRYDIFDSNSIYKYYDAYGILMVDLDQMHFNSFGINRYEYSTLSTQ